MKVFRVEIVQMIGRTRNESKRSRSGGGGGDGDELECGGTKWANKVLNGKL